MTTTTQGCLTILAVGDVAPNREDPPSLFQHCMAPFVAADIVFGQMEVPLSDRGAPAFSPHTPLKFPAHNARALGPQGAGFDVMSFACNHAMDFGNDAFFDTLDALRANNIEVVGAGANIAAARTPVIVERNGVKVGFLAYLSIISAGLIAEETIPGCVPLRAHSYYEQVDFNPGTAPLVVTHLFTEDKQAMEADIRALRPLVDVVVVSIHAGVHIAPAIIAMYQKEAAYAAIDCGADVVMQHHSHILKGVEMYKGKAVFYGMNNFAFEFTRMTPHVVRAWDHNCRRLLTELHRVKVHSGYPKHRYHFDALKTILAKIYVFEGRVEKVTFLPAYINPDLEPQVLTRDDPRAQEVMDYMAAISEDQNLKVSLAWDGDEVLVTA